MSFLNPQALYYLLPPLIMLFVLLLTQKESQAHFFSQEVMDKLRVGANSLTLRARNALFFIVGIFMVLALAQPVIDDGVVVVKAKSADIMIALDISDSMLGEDVYPNRLELAKQKALTLLADAPDERIGVMAFAKSSYLVSPLSFDTKAVSFLLSQLDTSSITEKGTDFLSILEVFNESSESKGKKYLLLLSDGGDKDDFSQEIEMAKESDIVVFILGVGSKKGAPIKLSNGDFIKQNGEVIISKLNDSISDLATSTGGVYIQNSTSDADIKKMFEEIKSIGEEKEFKSEEIKKFIPLFYYPLGMALFLLLIATSSMFKKTRVDIAVVFMVLAFSTLHVESKAGVLDFMDLNEAKRAYEAGEYGKSTKLYDSYAKDTQNPEAYFNTGNSLYKEKKYKQAQASYEKALFDDDLKKAQNLSNIGNSLAKQQQLEKAVESYEKSLEIQEDKQTRENLDKVKELIKEQEKQKEKESKENKDDKKDSDENKKSDDSKEGDKDSKEKDKDKKNDDSSKSKDSKDKQQNKDDMKSKEEKEQEQKAKDEAKKKENEKKDKLEELDKNDENKTSGASGSPKALAQDEMSDAEQKKWLNQLNMQKNTYLYKLDKQQPKKDTSDEKPW